MVRHGINKLILYYQIIKAVAHPTITNYLLPITYYQLPITNYPLPITI
ncbi:MAG: hypothetical protein AAF757_04690 [Cyanobacteria bacterium P01_D01_bin.116]